MPHLNTKPGEHDHTASAFVIRIDGDEPRLLLHMHKKLHRYIQFGGHIETDENPWQAVSHELLEESGYAMSQMKILQPEQRMKNVDGAKLHPIPIYHNTHNFSETHFHTDIAYAFITDEDPKHEIAEGESSDLILLTRQQLVDLATDKTFESVREPGIFVLDVCLKDWERVDPKVFD